MRTMGALLLSLACAVQVAWPQNQSDATTRSVGQTSREAGTPGPAVTVHSAHEGHDLRDATIAGGAGFLLGLVAGHYLGGRHSPEKVLSHDGPQIPHSFTMSSLTILGFVKGNWPMVLEYEITEPGLYLLTVSADNTAPFTYLLDASHFGHRQVIIRNLPERFGPTPRAGSYTLQAMSNHPGEVTPVFLRVFGIGAGDRAVGSVAIDGLRFGPAEIGAQNRGTALYGFHSRADFERVTAEFNYVGKVQGCVVSVFEDKQDIKDVVRRDTTIDNKQWDLRKAKAKPGQHMLAVRAWYTLKSGGDWVMAWSPQLVRVDE
jgi:hypothetical protein